MKLTIPLTTLLILGLMTFRVDSQKVIEYRDERCTGVIFDPYVLPESVNNYERDFNKNSFFSNYTKLFDFYRDPDSTRFMRLINWQYGLFLTLVVLIFISFLIFFALCCCKWNCSESLRNACFWIFILFFIVFVALFITAIVFLSIAQARYQKGSCASYQALSALLYGNPKVNHRQEFIGYSNFVTLIQNYENEAANLRGKETNFSNIINKELWKGTESLAGNSLAFWRQYQGEQIRNENGTLYSPNVISKSEPAVSLFIESEINSLDIVNRDLTESASQARFMADEDYVRDTRNGLAELRTNLTSVYQRMQNISETYIDEERLANRYIIATFWTFFALGILLIILFLIAICCFFSVRNDQTERRGRKLCCLKTILIVSAFLALGFGICVLVYMAGLGIASSYCRFLSELNRGGFEALSVFKNIVDNSTDQNGKPHPKISNFVETCLYKNSTGNLPDLINSTSYVRNSYQRLINLLEGPKVWDLVQNYTNNLSNQRSPAVQSQLNEWANLRDGILPDNEHIDAIFDNFTITGSCSNQDILFTKAQCLALNLTSNCQGLDSLASYSAPACVNDGPAQLKRYENLKAYINSERALVTKLSNDLTNSNVAVGYKNNLDNLKSLTADVQVFKEALPKTLGVFGPFYNANKKTILCSNLQVEVHRIERHLCFAYIRPVNILFCVAAFATLFLLFLLWALCLALLSVESEARETTIITKKDILTVSEVELVPKY